MIGKGDGMPWDVPDEYQHFVDCVRDQVVIIGRRSFDIFGADFHADTFVISRKKSIENATVCSSVTEALVAARPLNKTVFIAGGRSIYELGIPHATRMLLSTIKGVYEGDTYFPEFDLRKWSVVNEQDRGAYRLRDWRRRGSPNAK